MRRLAHGGEVRPRAASLRVSRMKTLIIAEKPSVGRDIAGALDGPFQKRSLADLNPRAKKGGKDDGPFSSPTTT